MRGNLSDAASSLAVNTTSPLRLDGRSALVTGCGSDVGIGFACARILAELGARVTITSTTDRIETRAAELRAAGATAVHSHVADLTDPAGARALVAAAERANGPLDVLVNNAAWLRSASRSRTPTSPSCPTRRSGTTSSSTC